MIPNKIPAVVIGGLTLIRPVGMASIPVVMVAKKEESHGRHSKYVRKYYLANPSNEEELLNTLVDIGKELTQILGNKIVLYYGTDSVLRFIYNNHEMLSEYYAYVLNDALTRELLIDKWKFNSFSNDNNLLVPKTILLSELDDHINELKFPVLVKPKVTFEWSRSRDVLEFMKNHGKAIIFQSVEKVKKCQDLKNFENDLILQEYVEGEDTSIFSYHGFATENNEILASYVGKKIRTFPRFVGYSSYLELIKDDNLNSIGENIIKRMNVKGVFKIDFKKNSEDGKYYMMEINARFNLWNHLGAVNGINIPCIVYDYLVNGVRNPVKEYGTDYRWLDFPKDYYAYRELKQVKKINFREWIINLLSSRKVYELFSWRDPVPFVVWSGKLILRKAKELKSRIISCS